MEEAAALQAAERAELGRNPKGGQAARALVGWAPGRQVVTGAADNGGLLPGGCKWRSTLLVRSCPVSSCPLHSCPCSLPRIMLSSGQSAATKADLAMKRAVRALCLLGLAASATERRLGCHRALPARAFRLAAGGTAPMPHAHFVPSPPPPHPHPHPHRSRRAGSQKRRQRCCRAQRESSMGRCGRGACEQRHAAAQLPRQAPGAPHPYSPLLPATRQAGAARRHCLPGCQLCQAEHGCRCDAALPPPPPARAAAQAECAGGARHDRLSGGKLGRAAGGRRAVRRNSTGLHRAVQLLVRNRHHPKLVLSVVSGSAGPRMGSQRGQL